MKTPLLTDQNDQINETLASSEHQDNQQNCYTTNYLIKPWALTFDPCDLWDCDIPTEGNEKTHVAWVFCWLPCCIACCPCTLAASLFGCLIGAGKDIHNFPKKDLTQLDDSKGISMRLFFKKQNKGPERQVMQEKGCCLCPEF